eukprot:TRINITY_DN23817_c0_g1_i1.p1 TRINITY_DN23817_c0_g1~~TRINITY_DN23817_c0_g1_i1.p1  ORF type:complete len:706 (-),score=106.95 TRINITY_DN23817_c0_g1_i1:449-2566(-)
MSEVSDDEQSEDMQPVKSGSLWRLTDKEVERIPGKSGSLNHKNYDFIMAERQTVLTSTDVTWAKILSSAGSLLGKLFNVSDTSGECIACAVADPQLPDCPLIYISHQFEQLTGYYREWVIGRNCRFLQPKMKEVNTYYNKEECTAMRHFCTGVKRVGSRIVTLLLNESATDIPFWNLLLMEHIEVAGRPYILGVQTNLEHESRTLAELTVQTQERREELSRLRSVCRSQEAKLGDLTMQAFAAHCIGMWAQDFPWASSLPTLPPKSQLTKDLRVGGWPCTCTGELQLAGLHLTKDTDLYGVVTKALQEGVRHFYLTVPGYCDSGSKFQHPGETVGDRHIMILRIASLCYELKRNFYHYVGRAVSFSIITRPGSVDDFQPIQKIFVSNGYIVHSWLLDCTSISPAMLASSWSTMSAAHAAGDVMALGCLGGSATLLEAWPRGAPLRLWAMEMYPGKIADAYHESRHCQLMSKLRNMGAQCIIYNILGPKSILSADERFMELADQAQLDPVSFGMKWAEAQGFAVLLQQLHIKMESENDNEQESGSDVYLKWGSKFAKSYILAKSAETCMNMHLKSARAFRSSSEVFTSIGLASTGNGRRLSLPVLVPKAGPEDPPKTKLGNSPNSRPFPSRRMSTPAVLQLRPPTSERPAVVSSDLRHPSPRRMSTPLTMQPLPPSLERPAVENPRHRKTARDLNGISGDPRIVGG